jgi:hypothetical protein
MNGFVFSINDSIPSFESNPMERGSIQKPAISSIYFLTRHSSGVSFFNKTKISWFYGIVYVRIFW